MYIILIQRLNDTNTKHEVFVIEQLQSNIGLHHLCYTIGLKKNLPNFSATLGGCNGFS